MRKIILLLIIIAMFSYSVSAMEFTPPQAPDSAQTYMPQETETFGEGLWYIIKSAITKLHPSIAEASGVCLSLITVVLLLSMLQGFSGVSKNIVELAGTLTVGLLLMRPTNTLIHLGTETVRELSEYGKLLLPVMTASMAAQGGATSSAALYTGTAFFNTILTTGISKLLVPLVYMYIAICIANGSIGQKMLKSLKDFLKWLMTWFLKIVIYLFTGYIGITGVVSGATDAAAVKATKLAISGFVPVVGNIISDASETILISAGIMKSAVGIYGLLALIAVWIGPFIQIGIQYLMLKITAAICGVFASKSSVDLVHDFSGAMGFLLAMTGTVCLLLLVSTVCFMKGVA